jgi:radical SAM protein with 4Fe4S-binding SPASM domain
LARALKGEHLDPRPRLVVWELTLRCDHACGHCGSRAGKPRQRELDTAEAIAVVEQLAGLGTREIAFIGGEAYLHPGWTDIAAAAVGLGIRATMVTGGRALDQARVAAAAAAGISAISVSIDGRPDSHDRLRNLSGSHAAAVAAVRRIRRAGIAPYANTQLSRVNAADVEYLVELFIELGVRAWQVGLTVPLGRAADRPDRLLQPFELLGLMPRIAAAERRLRAHRCLLQPANNLGYFGPYERVLRREFDAWAGCSAGVHVLGIESNGDLKGCPSLPSAAYVGGNLRERPVAEVWARAAELAFARRDRSGELWGFCASCPYARACRGGCSFTAHALLGRRGNNPWCHYRALALAGRGLAERLVPVAAAPGLPFDHGRFEIVKEPMTDAHRAGSPARVSLPVVG